MNTTKQKSIYLTGLVLTALWFGSSGLFEITRNPLVWNKTIALGYPAYFITTLGIAKLLGVLILILPTRKGIFWLKEWVFAGLFFDIFFATVSGCAVFGASDLLPPIIAFLMVMTTYLMFRKHNYVSTSGEPQVNGRNIHGPNIKLD
tara:strand:- start:19366 stop:19806 length:441 start_codon:yes stop_codon:yes gene_type:complete